MQFKASLLVMFVLIGFVLQAEAGGMLLGLNLLKNGLPFIASTGLLGAVKLALMTKAGFALGTVGTVLGATALKHSHGNDDYYYHQPSYGYGHGYGHGYRKRRDVDNLDNEEFDAEEAFRFVKKSDPSQCSERLVCELSAKAGYNPSQIQSDEISILSVVKAKPYNRQTSEAHFALESAMRQGYNGADCSVQYDTCAYNGEEMMSLIRLFNRSLLQTPTSAIRKLLFK